MTEEQDPRAALEEAVQGKSDEEIQEFVDNMGGSEQLLDLIFSGMAEALDPEKAQDCVLGFELTEDGTTHAYTVTVEGKSATWEKKQPEGARVTLGMSVPDYLRLITGNLDGMQAFMQGKLKLKGDMMFAQQIQNMFRQ